MSECEKSVAARSTSLESMVSKWPTLHGLDFARGSGQFVYRDSDSRLEISVRLLCPPPARCPAVDAFVAKLELGRRDNCFSVFGAEVAIARCLDSRDTFVCFHRHYCRLRYRGFDVRNLNT